MLIPLTHDEMTVQRLPWVTIALIVLNIVAFVITWPTAQREQDSMLDVLVEMEELESEHPGITRRDFADFSLKSRFDSAQERFAELQRTRLFVRYGFVPNEPSWTGLFGSMFLHAGWMHLFGNLYLLWLCGCTIEDNWGRPLFGALYVVSGIVAANVQAAAFPESAIPLVGASGAISGLMGIFLIRYFRTKIRFFYTFFVAFGTFHAPAWLMLPFWIVNQVMSAVWFSGSSGVAFWAHVGGFVFGIFAAVYIKWTYVEQAYLMPSLHRATNLIGTSRNHREALRAMEEGRGDDAVRLLNGALSSNRDDVEALKLLAQAHLLAGRWPEAEAACKQELALRIRRQESEEAIATYFDLRDSLPQATLDARTRYTLAGYLVRSEEYWDAGIDLYESILRDGGDRILRLRAAIALADTYCQLDRHRSAHETLRFAAPLAEGSPEWEAMVADKLSALERT